MGSSAWQRTLITEVHGARELHAPWVADQRGKSVGPDKLEVVASFYYLGDMLSAACGCELSTTTQTPGRSSRSCYQFSLPATSLSRHVATCTAPVCRAQCYIPVRLGHWQSQTSNICSKMTGQWSDRSAYCQATRHCHTRSKLSYLRSFALRIWTSFFRREGFAGMDVWTTPLVQSRQAWTYGLMESLGGPRWHESSWQRGIAKSVSFWLSTLMTDM